MNTDKAKKSNNVKFAILGPGRIAHTFAQAMQSVSSATIAIVHSTNENRAKQFAAEYSIKHHTSNIEDVLQDPDLDVVYISYPHTLHFDAIRLCLDHNKHVLCEKPLTTSAGQAEQVIAIARERNLLLMEALWTRFLPIWRQVKHWIENRCIGEINTIKSSFGINTAFDPNSRLFNPELGGGTLWDLGIYPISMSNFITSQFPNQLDAKITRGQTGVDEHTKVVMTYPSGVTSRFETSFRAELSNQFIVYGSEGTITISAPFWGAEQASISSAAINETIELPHNPNGFEYQIEHVVDLITSNAIESPIISWTDTLETQRIIEELLTYS